MNYTNLLLNGLTGEKRKEMLDIIMRAKPFMDIVTKKIQEELSKEQDPDFDSPAWAYKQAYKMGYTKGLTKLIRYGTLTPSKE